jgi:hypothetical protein
MVSAKDAGRKAVPVAHMCGHDMHVAWLTWTRSRPVLTELVHCRRNP